MSDYKPRPGSLVEKGVEFLRQHPDGVTGVELAEAIGRTTENIGAIFAQALVNGLVVKERTGANRAIYRLGRTDDTAPCVSPPGFSCAVWSDGVIYMEGASVDEKGGVSLSVAQARILARVINGEVLPRRQEGEQIGSGVTRLAIPLQSAAPDSWRQ